MSLEDELAELDKEYANRRQDLLNIHATLHALPAYVADFSPRIHFHSLYGRDCSVSITHNWFAYGKDVKHPDLSLLGKLGTDLPPLPLVMVRDGCLSFRLKEHVEALPEAKKERWESETDVCPFLVKVSGFQHQSAEFSWWTRLAGFVVEVEVTLPLPAKLGRLDIAFKNRMGGRSVERCNFHPADAIQTLFRGDEPVAQLERPIKWASGSPETSNDFTLYWVALTDTIQPTIADLVKRLI